MTQVPVADTSTRGRPRLLVIEVVAVAEVMPLDTSGSSARTAVVLIPITTASKTIHL
jgi:hypothetical protein